MAGRISGNKRKDNNRVVLRTGEGMWPNGTYDYRWTDKQGKRHHIYARTLPELREKEEQIQRDISDGIKTPAKSVSVNDLFNMWRDLKRGLKDHTIANYLYMYDTYVRPGFGKKLISQLKKSDVKRFYNSLADEKGLSASTIDNIHTVLHQVFALAVDDCYIRNNPSDDVLRELKKTLDLKTEKRRALTKPEQDLLLRYLDESPMYRHWYPLIAIMIGTGMRVGEVTGLRWCDIDLEQGMIDINHTLVYYDHRTDGLPKGCYYSINTTKTPASMRQVPMLGFVKEAFLREKAFQEENDIRCMAKVNGYTDFIFVNRFGLTMNQATINKAIVRIIRDCNDSVAYGKDPSGTRLPHFSCHSLRHTFTTRMCEAGVNVKVIQETLGHTDISTTLNIYADVTKELKQKEFAGLDEFFTSGKS